MGIYYGIAISEYDKNTLSHHGILGQKWGVRRYQNKDGSYTPEGKERYGIKDSELKELHAGEQKDYAERVNNVQKHFRDEIKLSSQMLTKEDKEFLKEKQISEETLNHQLTQHREGFPFLKLVDAASQEKGILIVNDDQRKKVEL